MARILVIDDDPDVRGTMCSLVSRMRHQCEAAASLGDGRALLAAGDYDVVFLDVRLPDGNGLEAIPAIKETSSSPEVIILTGLGDPDGAELAIQAGAWDYLLKPSPIKQTMLILERALKYREEKRHERSSVALNLEGVVGRSPRLRGVYDLVASAANSNSNVLLTGETGTGKELFARIIHTNSSRASGPFVAVDCASLTETLVESTLFGHKKGAFTGADADRVGLVRLADGGTLFLDEVGEMPAAIQRTLLRVLQERRFRPVGGSQEISSDFRLVAATNRDLEDMVARGEFRSDLLFRLKTVHIELPPLRERKEDIKPLAFYYVDKLCEEYKLPGKALDSDLLDVLLEYQWPGNVRELFGVLERAFLASGRERTLFAMHLPQDLRIKVTKASLCRGRTPCDASGEASAPALSGRSDMSSPAEAPDEAGPESGTGEVVAESLKEFKDRMEQRYMVGLIRSTGGDIQRMLDLSGLSRSHLYALLKKHDITLSV